MTDAGGTDPKRGAGEPGQAADAGGREPASAVSEPGSTGARGQQPRFDPRHDPVFQRGYDPAASVRPTRHARAVRRAEPSRPTDSAPRLLSPNRDSSTPPGAGKVLNPQLGEESEVTDAAGQAPQVPGVDGGPAPETRRNPFIVALWIVGVAFVVGGVALQWQATVNSYSGRGFNTDEVPFEVIMQQLVWTTTPAMISVGAMTLVGLVFWHAVTWRQARPGIAEPSAAEPDTGDWPEPNQNA